MRRLCLGAAGETAPATSPQPACFARRPRLEPEPAPRGHKCRRSHTSSASHGLCDHSESPGATKCLGGLGEGRRIWTRLPCPVTHRTSQSPDGVHVPCGPSLGCRQPTALVTRENLGRVVVSTQGNPATCHCFLSGAASKKSFNQVYVPLFQMKAEAAPGLRRVDGTHPVPTPGPGPCGTRAWGCTCAAPYRMSDQPDHLGASQGSSP